jgi:hypothetical protein
MTIYTFPLSVPHKHKSQAYQVIAEEATILDSDSFAEDLF